MHSNLHGKFVVTHLMMAPDVLLSLSLLSSLLLLLLLSSSPSSLLLLLLLLLLLFIGFIRFAATPGRSVKLALYMIVTIAAEIATIAGKSDERLQRLHGNK